MIFRISYPHTRKQASAIRYIKSEPTVPRKYKDMNVNKHSIIQQAEEV